MLRYEVACSGSSIDPIDLYRWAGSVALAVFDDVAVVEVAMRSAMARELGRTFGMEWFTREDLLDDDSLRLVRNAWTAGRLSRLEASPDVIHGKLVASLMLGFWVKLLGRGTYQGSGADRDRRIYDSLLWKPSLRRAFPDADDLDRARVESLARRVTMLRNRIAHHEHIVWGIPVAGETDADGTTPRISLTDAHEILISLSRTIDAGLAGWLRDYSKVRSLITACPLSDRSKLLL